MLIDVCLSVGDCGSCVGLSGCLWDSGLGSCHSSSSGLSGLTDVCPVVPPECQYYSDDCAACLNHGCVYGATGDAGQCNSSSDGKDCTITLF